MGYIDYLVYIGGGGGGGESAPRSNSDSHKNWYNYTKFQQSSANHF